MGGYVITTEAVELWLTWRAHCKLSYSFHVCEALCGQRWPCATRREAEAALTGMGVDPYEVLRRGRWWRGSAA